MIPSFVRKLLPFVVPCALAAPLEAQEGARRADAPTASGTALHPVRLRPGDHVRLEVRDEPTLAGEFTVDASGRALFPLIGLVAVAERDFDSVGVEVASRFADELVDPVLRVTPVYRIAVLGEVRTPGLFPVDPTFTLADVVAVAGGLTPSADRRAISLVRDGTTVAVAAADDLGRLRVELRSGDQVLVGRRSWLMENVNVLVGTASSLAVAVITALLLR